MILSFTSISSSTIRKSVLGAVFREFKQHRRRRLRKRHLKSEVALRQTLSRLFHLVQFVKYWPYFLELTSTRLYCPGKEKESRCLELRVSNKFFGMRDFPYLRLGIRDFKGKSVRDSGLKVCAGGGMPKVTLGITGLPENLGRDYGIEKPYWGPS